MSRNKFNIKVVKYKPFFNTSAAALRLLKTICSSFESNYKKSIKYIGEEQFILISKNIIQTILKGLATNISAAALRLLKTICSSFLSQKIIISDRLIGSDKNIQIF